MGIHLRNAKEKKYSAQKCKCGGFVPLSNDLSDIKNFLIAGKCIKCGQKHDFIS